MRHEQITKSSREKKEPRKGNYKFRERPNIATQVATQAGSMNSPRQENRNAGSQRRGPGSYYASLSSQAALCNRRRHRRYMHRSYRQRTRRPQGQRQPPRPVPLDTPQHMFSHLRNVRFAMLSSSPPAARPVVPTRFGNVRTWVWPYLCPCLAVSAPRFGHVRTSVLTMSAPRISMSAPRFASQFCPMSARTSVRPPPHLGLYLKAASASKPLTSGHTCSSHLGHRHRPPPSCPSGGRRWTPRCRWNSPASHGCTCGFRGPCRKMPFRHLPSSWPTSRGTCSQRNRRAPCPLFRFVSIWGSARRDWLCNANLPLYGTFRSCSRSHLFPTTTMGKLSLSLTLRICCWKVVISSKLSRDVME